MGGIVGTVFIIVVTLFAMALFASALTMIRNYEKGVVEHFGKYHRMLDPGLNFVMPVIQAVKRVDLREKVIDVPPQEVITQDNVMVTVDAVVYYQITDPRRVLYNIDNFQLATLKLAQTNLRNVIGDLELDETLTSREKINTELRQVLDDATDAWGVRITRVEIQKIDPPRDITEAMSQQMKAERERRAAILEAEGVKQSAILRAEGQKQSAILASHGEAEAVRQRAQAERDRRIAVAEGEAEAIQTVFRAINEGGATDEVLAIRYLETLQAVADGQATKIFLPMEMSGIMSSVGSLGEMLRGTQPRERMTGGEPASPSADVTWDE